MEERRQTWLKNLAESRGGGGGKRKRRWSAMTKVQSSFQRVQVVLALGTCSIFLRLSCNFVKIMFSENSRHEKVGENRAARKGRYHKMIQRERKKAQFARSI